MSQDSVMHPLERKQDHRWNFQRLRVGNLVHFSNK